MNGVNELRTSLPVLQVRFVAHSKSFIEVEPIKPYMVFECELGCESFDTQRLGLRPEKKSAVYRNGSVTPIVKAKGRLIEAGRLDKAVGRPSSMVAVDASRFRRTPKSWSCLTHIEVT